MSDSIFFAPLKVPVTDSRTGLMSREWYLFFQAIFLRIGGTQAFSADDQQLVDDINDATGNDIRTTDLESALTDDQSSSTDFAELQALAISEETVIARFTAQWDGITPASGGGAVNFLRADGTWAVPAYPTVPVGANPTAAVGLAAANGAAVTFMRSDAAPPLDQGIIPTWTAVHTFSARPVFNAGSTVNGQANIYTVSITASSTANQSFGLNLLGGTSATDAALLIRDQTGSTQFLKIDGVGNIGFRTAAPIAKPAITGSRAANAALASFLTALANYGLITDSTTP